MSRLPATPDAGPMPKVILVVEDHDASRDFVVRMFRYKGWEPIQASSIPEALAVVADVGRLLDLVILDLMLPGGPDQDGTAVCRAIRESGLAVPVYAWTASDSGDPLHARAIRAGVDGILIKPFTGPEQFNALARGERPPKSDRHDYRRDEMPEGFVPADYRPDEGC